MEPLQALKLLVGILNQTTMINRGGRESGLTVDERAAISQASHSISQALTAKPAESKAKPKRK